MTAKGHFIFSIALVILVKKIVLLPFLKESNNWGHIFFGAIFACLLPDIDHPQSWLGRKIKFISVPISRFFGHRSITHSFVAIFLYIHLINNNFLLKIFPYDIMEAFIISYIGHIIADCLTPSGVPLLWPFFFRLRIPIIRTHKKNLYEKFFCILILIFSILYPIDFFYIKNFFEKFYNIF